MPCLRHSAHSVGRNADGTFLHERTFAHIEAEGAASCRLVIIDTKDSWAQELVESGHAHKLITADLSNSEHVFDICMEAISKVEQVRSPHLLSSFQFD